MGKKKQTSTQTNQYAYMTPPENKYFHAAEQLIAGYDGGASAVREAWAKNRNDITESGNEFLGANTTDEVRSKVRDSRLFRNNMDLGRNLLEAKNNEIQYKNAGYMSLGGATAPQLVQTGGTTNSAQWGSGLYSPLGGVALGGLAA